jgi:CHAT domain-containing protein
MFIGRQLNNFWIFCLTLALQSSSSLNAQALNHSTLIQSSLLRSDKLQSVVASRQNLFTRPGDKLDFVGQDSKEIIALELDKPIERKISGGQTQRFQISLTTGQFVGVRVRQSGIDVGEKVLAPDGKLTAEYNSEIRPQGEERADFVAETTGIYRLDVAGQVIGTTGRYEIRLTEMRAANEHDRALDEARRLSAQAHDLSVAGKYNEALPLAERALELSEKELGQEHADVAYLLERIGWLYSNKGNYARAGQLFQRALDIDKRALGLEHPQTAEALQGLGDMYSRTDEYGKAEELLQQALTLTEQTLGPEHPRVEALLKDISVLHFNRGDVARSEQESQRALAIADKTLAPDDFEVSQLLSNLGLIYIKGKDYARAEPLLQRSLLIAEKKFGPDSSRLSMTLQNLGLIAQEQKKDYPRALELYWRAAKNLEQSLGQEHPQVAAILNNLANIYKTQGDYQKALELHQRVRAIFEKSLGPYHGNTIVSLGNIASTYTAMGDVADAIKFQMLMDEAVEKNLMLNLAIGSERQKLAYFDTLSNRTDRTISLHALRAPDDATARDLAAQVILQRKGRVLDAMADSLATLRQRLNTEDQKLLDQLNAATAQLAKLALNGRGSTPPEEYQQQLAALTEQKENLEAEISQRSAEFRAQSQTVTLAAVKAAIPPNAALVEFALYRPFDPKIDPASAGFGEPRYIAYIIQPQDEVKWKELGAAKEIDARVNALRQALGDPQRRDAQELARAVDEKVMRPVRELLGDSTQLLVSPDGSLNLIPFGALVDEAGRYLVQRFAFTYLSSGRDLLRIQVARESLSKPLILANPLFGEPASQLLAKVNATTKPSTPSGRRRSITNAVDLSDVYFAPLEGTATEARAIETLFPEAQLLTGAQATKTALKQAAAPRVLHIATHGFFLSTKSEPAAVATGPIKLKPVPDQAGQKGSSPGAVATGPSTNSAQMTTRRPNPASEITNPLLRSGLALAGANLRNSGDDGILTALEASGLNLWGTKLVVLSACDTGLGEVRNGDGVYGLRRAFVLAGAESLVMSLWPISDYTTRELMTGYYKNLKQGLGRGEALRQVQLDMLKHNPKLHPFYWANFIQSGAWTSLDGKR